MNERLRRKLALVKHPLHRLIITVLVYTFVIFGRLLQPEIRRGGHWVGQGGQRPPRVAGRLLAIVLFAGFFLAYAQETRQALLWALAWGLLFSLIVILQSILLIFKRRHS